MGPTIEVLVVDLHQWITCKYDPSSVSFDTDKKNADGDLPFVEVMWFPQGADPSRRYLTVMVNLPSVGATPHFAHFLGFN
jgi:hypothetical protein